MDLYQIIEKPLVTEKGTDMLADGNWVVFRVNTEANKIQIREAVQKIFNVKSFMSIPRLCGVSAGGLARAWAS